MVDQEIMLGLLAEGWRSPEWVAALAAELEAALKKCITLEEENDKAKERVQRLQNTVLENIEEIKTLKARVKELEGAEKMQNILLTQRYLTSLGLPDYMNLAEELLNGGKITTDYPARKVTITARDGTVVYVKGWEEP